MKRILALILCATFLCGVGGNVLMLQAVAWAKMTYDFSKHDSLTVALKKTLDGKHPCEICKNIEKNAAPQLASAAVEDGLKTLQRVPLVRFDFVGPQASVYANADFSYRDSLFYPPPKRPPRFA